MTTKSLRKKHGLRRSAQRWQRRKESRPDEIVAAALACFVDKGFNATLLDEVAARAGIAKGTLYRYFDSKEVLFRAVVRANLVGEIAAAERDLANSGRSSTELLPDFIQRTAASVTSPIGVLAHVVFAEAARFPDLARFYFDEVIARGIGLMELLIRRGIATGEFRRVDARSAAFCIIAPIALEALFRLGLEPHARRTLDVGKLTTTLANTSVAGLRARGTRQ